MLIIWIVSVWLAVLTLFVTLMARRPKVRHPRPAVDRAYLDAAA
jgi:hypothetical protein